MSGEPKVSVLVPARDRETMIGPCLLSVLAQTYQNLAVVVLDDGSHDGTFRVASSFAKSDPRVRVVRGGASRGVAAARNKLLDLVPRDADLACWQDSDDLSHPMRLAMQVQHMRAKRASMCFTGEDIFKGDPPTSFSETPTEGTARVGRVPHASLMFPPRTGPRFDEGITVYGEDTVWFFEMELAVGRATVLDRRLYYRRIHAGCSYHAASVAERRASDRCRLRAVELILVRHAAGELRMSKERFMVLNRARRVGRKIAVRLTGEEESP